VNAHFVFFFAFLTFLTFGLSFSGLGDVLNAPFSAVSKRAWASFSLYLSPDSLGPPTMVKNPPFARGRRLCLFCAGPGLSREHIWADWLKAYIKKDDPRHEISSLFHPAPQRPEMIKEIKKQEGDVRSRRLRVVCKTCNNGWMSRLQNRAKPILIPLLTGESATLSILDQQIIAAWATMTVMVGEYIKAETAVITQSERDHLRLTNTPPPTWKIWIANLAVTDLSAWVSGRFPVIKSEDIAHPHDNGIPRPNVQETSFIVGKLFIRTVSSPFPEIVNLRQFTVEDERSLIIPIWPQRFDELVWPPRIAIGKDDWVIAVSRLFELIERSHNRS
jgi:hypothetical protein